MQEQIIKQKNGGNFGNKIFKLKIIYSKILNYFQSDFLKTQTIFMKKTSTKNVYKRNTFRKNRIQRLRIVYTRKAFKIGELLVEQLYYTEFRNTKFLISLSRQIEHFWQFFLDY